jgi:ParB family chromosome partitioning protein
MSETRDLFGHAETVRPPHYRTTGSGKEHWYTPARYIEAARNVLGEIDLDPASDHHAQQTVRANQFFTLADHSLLRPWYGRVWLNPPYSRGRIEQFVGHLIGELADGHVAAAILLTHANTDTNWFDQAGGDCAALCLTRGRIRFEDADGNKAAPDRGQAFFYFGPHRDRFWDVFRLFGSIWYPASGRHSRARPCPLSPPDAK